MNAPSLRFVRSLGVSLTLVAVPLAPGLASADGPAKPSVDETQKTKAAVIAVDEHWGRAEVTGDVAFLQAMLLPEYRTINPDGVAHTKADLLARAEKNRGSQEMLRKVEEYRKTHPYGTSVVLDGDLAILSFYDPALGPEKGVRSSDVFVYRDRRWRAAYSQHSNAGK